MQRSSENSIIISHNKVELCLKAFIFWVAAEGHAFQNSICAKWSPECAFSKAHLNSNNAWPSPQNSGLKKKKLKYLISNQTDHVTIKVY